MVGFQYGGPEGPVRVAGRAYGPPIKSLDSESVTHAWENAQYRDVPSSGYGLTIKNTSSKTSVDQCMKMPIRIICLYLALVIWKAIIWRNVLPAKK